MHHSTTNDEHTVAWLRLIRAEGIGRKTINVLLTHFPGIASVYDATPASLKSCGLSERQIAALSKTDEERLELDLQWLNQASNGLVTIDSPDYPAQLRQAPDPPPALFTTGNIDLMHLPQLAIVGARNPTPGGRQTAEDFAAFLASGGFCITSGLALGIDAAAHNGALSGNGHTIAVTGTGLDRVYPAENRDLAHRIAQTDLLVSEFPPGTGARPGHFPSRNRIIAGLSVGTLVVEAAIKSGSLITARMAVEAGREVFAIPGSIHNPLAHGCHSLIRQGAKLVEKAADIVEELGGTLTLEPAQDDIPVNSREKAQNNHSPDPEYSHLLEQMGYDPVTIDQLTARTNLTAGEISSMLLLLELEGYVSSAAGGQFTRLKA